MEFRCVEECSQCCIEREYYPTKQFGKIGVLILPVEKERIEKQMRKHAENLEFEEAAQLRDVLKTLDAAELEML